MRYGYIRVSSDKQTVENQRFEIEQFCLREGVQVDGWIEETVSGTTIILILDFSYFTSFKFFKTLHHLPCYLA